MIRSFSLRLFASALNTQSARSQSSSTHLTQPQRAVEVVLPLRFYNFSQEKAEGVKGKLQSYAPFLKYKVRNQNAPRCAAAATRGDANFTLRRLRFLLPSEHHRWDEAVGPRL